MSSGLSLEQMVGFSLVHSLLSFPGCGVGEVKLVHVYYMTCNWLGMCMFTYSRLVEGPAHYLVLSPVLQFVDIAIIGLLLCLYMNICMCNVL